MKTEIIELAITYRIQYDTPKGRQRAIRDAIKGDVESMTFGANHFHSVKRLKKRRILNHEETTTKETRTKTHGPHSRKPEHNDEPSSMAACRK